MIPVSKEELEVKARKYYDVHYRKQFRKTKIIKALTIAMGALVVAGLWLATGAVAGQIFIEEILPKKYVAREMAKDGMDGTLKERFKNGPIKERAESLEKESEGFSAKATELKTQANELRVVFGLAIVPAPDATVAVSALPHLTAAKNSM